MKMNKALRQQYSQQKFRMGVFQIRNTVNRKIFLGSSVNLEAIWNRNRMELNLGSHRNEALQKDWKVFGENSFVFEILSEIKQEDNEQLNYNREAKKLEEMFIEALQPFGEKGYHIRKHVA
jgi:group I intron endonuclease